MVIICDDPHGKVAPIYDHLLGRMSPTVRDHVLQFRFLKDRELSLCGYSLLLEGLDKYFNLKPAILDFDYSPAGKPSLKGYSSIHFNISHCDKAVACALSEHPIGVDVECVSNFTPDLIDFCMNPSEASAIRRSDDQALSFLEYWTMKESLLKLTGEGLRDDLKSVLNDTKDYQFIKHTDPQGQYVCTEAHFKLLGNHFAE